MPRRYRDGQRMMRPKLPVMSASGRLLPVGSQAEGELIPGAMFLCEQPVQDL